MKKKNLTVNEIEEKLREMGGMEVSEEEFNSSDEYKSISRYVKKMFRMPKRKRILKIKSVR